MSAEQQLAEAVIDKMIEQDHFSQWLGIELLEIKPGYCRLQMQVKEEMLNGFGILHGGVSFALADSAFAFASNTHGRLSMSINASMTYTHPGKKGDVLIAEAQELHLGNKTATYDIQVRRMDGTQLCMIRGTVYRTSKQHISE